MNYSIRSPRIFKMLCALFFAAFVGGLALTLSQAPIAHASTITVTNTNDSGAGSLRQAIASAATNDTIKFSVSGPGASILAISGAMSVRVFEITTGFVTISSLTIRDGNSSPNNGNGVLNNGRLTLNDVALSNNNGFVDNGGGIYTSGAITLTNVVLDGN